MMREADDHLHAVGGARILDALHVEALRLHQRHHLVHRVGVVVHADVALALIEIRVFVVKFTTRWSPIDSRKRIRRRAARRSRSRGDAKCGLLVRTLKRRDRVVGVLGQVLDGTEHESLGVQAGSRGDLGTSQLSHLGCEVEAVPVWLEAAIKEGPRVVAPAAACVEHGLTGRRAGARGPQPPERRTSSPRPRVCSGAGRARTWRGRWPRGSCPGSRPRALLDRVDDQHRLEV